MKHLSFSMLPKTIAMENSTNNAHILKHGLQFKGGFIVAA
jgi:hypothetical protein